jgi:hypothetical protein
MSAWDELPEFLGEFTVCTTQPAKIPTTILVCPSRRAPCPSPACWIDPSLPPLPCHPDGQRDERLMLSQAIYWQNRCNRTYKPAEWRETGLSRDSTQAACGPVPTTNPSGQRRGRFTAKIFTVWTWGCWLVLQPSMASANLGVRIRQSGMAESAIHSLYQRVQQRLLQRERERVLFRPVTTPDPASCRKRNTQPPPAAILAGLLGSGLEPETHGLAAGQVAWPSAPEQGRLHGRTALPSGGMVWKKDFQWRQHRCRPTAACG